MKYLRVEWRTAVSMYETRRQLQQFSVQPLGEVLWRIKHCCMPIYGMRRASFHTILDIQIYIAQLIFPCMICLLPYLLLYGGNFWYILFIYSFFLISCIYVTVSLLFQVYMGQFPYYFMYICDSFLLIPGIIVTVSFLFHV